MVRATLLLAYPKWPCVFLRSTCVIYVIWYYSFQNFLSSSIVTLWSCDCDSYNHNIIFLNQQFITLSMRVDHSSYVLGTVHTRMKVRRIDLEMSGLVEQPWLQLMCCAVCLPYGCNFRWWGEVQDGSEYWLVYCCWTLEIKFNKRLSSSIIRLANYNVTTSLIYKLIV